MYIYHSAINQSLEKETPDKLILNDIHENYDFTIGYYPVILNIRVENSK